MIEGAEEAEEEPWMTTVEAYGTSCNLSWPTSPPPTELLSVLPCSPCCKDDEEEEPCILFFVLLPDRRLPGRPGAAPYLVLTVLWRFTLGSILKLELDAPDSLNGTVGIRYSRDINVTLVPGV